MATIWLSTLGNDSNDGSTYVLAKATLNGLTGAISIALQGDTINVVNDGDHVCVDFTNLKKIGLKGTSWSNPGIVISGVDYTGLPATATVKATTTETWWLNLIDDIYSLHADFILVEGIKFDYTSCSSSVIQYLHPIRLTGNIGSVKIYDCDFIFTPGVGQATIIGNSYQMQGIFFDGSSYAKTTYSTLEITGCYFQNAAYMLLSSTEKLNMYVHHNVFIIDATYSISLLQQPIPISFNYDGGSIPDQDRIANNNTIYHVRYGTDRNSPAIKSNGIADTTKLQVHSNLVHSECGSGVVSGGISQAVLTGSLLAATGIVGLFGYDSISFGPNTSAFYNTWTTTNGIASYQFNDKYRASFPWNGMNIDANSVLRLSAAFADIFYDVTSSYVWTRSGSSYSHILPMDLRPINDFAVGYLKTTPGALPAYLAPIPPDEGEDISYPAVIDSLPFYRPVLKINLSVMSRIDRNRIIGHSDARHFLTDKHYDEDVSRIFTVAASSSSGPVYLSGVNKARVIMIETDQTVTFTIHTATQSFVVVVDELIVLDNSDVMYFEAANSGSTEATIKFLAVQ